MRRSGIQNVEYRSDMTHKYGEKLSLGKMSISFGGVAVCRALKTVNDEGQMPPVGRDANLGSPQKYAEGVGVALFGVVWGHRDLQEDMRAQICSHRACYTFVGKRFLGA